MILLAQDFQIVINSREEFDQAWAKLQELGYKVSHHSAERHYKVGGVIKHCSGHKYIWSSTMKDSSKRHFESFTSFCSRYGVSNSPTMGDVKRAVALLDEVDAKELEVTTLEAQLMARRAELGVKKEELARVQEKLGIK